jgi:hypothetical protein
MGWEGQMPSTVAPAGAGSLLVVRFSITLEPGVEADLLGSFEPGTLTALRRTVILRDSLAATVLDEVEDASVEVFFRGGSLFIWVLIQLKEILVAGIAYDLLKRMATRLETTIRTELLAPFGAEDSQIETSGYVTQPPSASPTPSRPSLGLHPLDLSEVLAVSSQAALIFAFIWLLVTR